MGLPARTLTTIDRESVEPVFDRRRLLRMKIELPELALQVIAAGLDPRALGSRAVRLGHVVQTVRVDLRIPPSRVPVDGLPALGARP